MEVRKFMASVSDWRAAVRRSIIGVGLVMTITLAALLPAGQECFIKECVRSSHCGSAS
jgi:hypothetical protein